MEGLSRDRTIDVLVTRTLVMMARFNRENSGSSRQHAHLLNEAAERRRRLTSGAVAGETE